MTTEAIVIFPRLRPDQYFTAVQQERMQELMAQRQSAWENGLDFPAEQLAELQALIQVKINSELQQTAQRLWMRLGLFP